MELLYFAFIVLLLLFLVWYRLAYGPYRWFKILNIPGPPVSPFFGNTLQLSQQGYDGFIKNCVQQHGKIFGFYVGSVPLLSVLDADVLKEILVKQFSTFHDRTIKERNVMTKVFGNLPGGLVFLNGDEWRRNRAIISPSFTTKKFKAMAPIVEEQCNSLNEQLDKIRQTNQSADMWKLLRKFTLQSLLATAFGFNVNILKGETHEIAETADSIFFNNTTMISIFWADTFGSQLPLVRTAAGYIVPRTKFGIYFQRLCNIAIQLIENRLHATNTSLEYKDFLQILIDAKKEEGEEDLSSSKKRLSIEEIASHSLDALVGGYESTTSCLSFTLYLLATNADKQDKLCQIIEDYYLENPDTTLYDASNNIPYLEWVINESLRMFPPFPRAARVCSETCTINGVKIAKDTFIDIPTKVLHYLPEYWDEPEEFIPERFSPEEKENRNPFCYMPFGLGPRTCIGMRFVMMEVKMTLLSILRKYKFQTAPDTQIPLKLRRGIAESPADGVFLKVASV